MLTAPTDTKHHQAGITLVAVTLIIVMAMATVAWGMCLAAGGHGGASSVIHRSGGAGAGRCCSPP